MPSTLRSSASAVVILLLLVACSPGASGTVTPRPSTSGPAATTPAPLATELRERYNPLILAMRTLEKPIVGAINGVAAGAGASLAFACDIRIAAEAAGEPCSYLTAAEVGAIVGTTPVEVAERIGRGDCDYWLSAAKDSKVNIAVFEGADATSYFDSTKGIGTPESVDVGDDAYAIFNASIGTVVVARSGDNVVSVQVFTADTGDQLAQATAIVEAVLGGL